MLHALLHRRLTWAAAVTVMALAITGWTSANASAIAPSKAPVVVSATALTMPTGAQWVVFHKALNQLRQANAAFRHETDTQILAQMNAHVHSSPVSGGTVMRPMVSGWGTGTLWFSHTDVAWYATAGTAAVLALIIATGIASLSASMIVGSLIATFWGAWAAGYCVWFTYRTPRSWGSYRC